MEHSQIMLKISTSKGESEPMPYAQAVAEAAKITGGAVVLLREGGKPDFHPHPANAGQWYLYQIVR